MSRDGILLGLNADREKLYLRLDKTNRHGLITGATGGGKTTTLQTLAKSFSDRGVAVFAPDVKGDLSGIAMPGEYGTPPPVRFWDIFQENGLPVKTTVRSMGSVLMSRLLDLTDAQTGVLNIAYHMSHVYGIEIATLADLSACLRMMNDKRKMLAIKYGNITPASIATIQRKVLELETQGATSFFGAPSFDVRRFIAHAPNLRGVVNVLAAEKLFHSPKLYATFMFWLLSELFKVLPEAGDLRKPRMVFFFDEAHLLFKDAPKVLLDKVEQTVRLVRSKGVGVFFVTQSPTDIPDPILAQLGNKVQHRLSAYSASEMRKVRAIAQGLPSSRRVDDLVRYIQGLGTGDALVSVLDEGGIPTETDLVRIRKPGTRLGPITPKERKAINAHT